MQDGFFNEKAAFDRDQCWIWNRHRKFQLLYTGICQNVPSSVVHNALFALLGSVKYGINTVNFKHWRCQFPTCKIIAITCPYVLWSSIDKYPNYIFLAKNHIFLAPSLMHCLSYTDAKGRPCQVAHWERLRFTLPHSAHSIWWCFICKRLFIYRVKNSMFIPDITLVMKGEI